jgi:hypothetical protein
MKGDFPNALRAASRFHRWWDFTSPDGPGASMRLNGAYTTVQKFDLLAWKEVVRYWIDRGWSDDLDTITPYDADDVYDLFLRQIEGQE